MLDRVKEFFKFNRTERNGTYVVMVLIFLVIVFNNVSHYFIHPPDVNPQQLQAMIDTLEARKARSKRAYLSSQQIQRELFSFNPNTLSDSGYARLGFSKKEMNILRKYMEKGGSFNVKKDFSKLFFVDDSLYTLLEPYIDLPEEKEIASGKYNRKTTPAVPWSDTADYKDYYYEENRADINWSDTNELKNVRGLGSYYANKIVERRNELGGYYSLSQLMEIYNMTPENMDRIAPYLSVDKSAITKLDINRVTAQELAHHPYISFKEANAIVLFREKNGPFQSIEDLEKANLLNAERSRKIAPYLNFTDVH